MQRISIPTGKYGWLVGPFAGPMAIATSGDTVENRVGSSADDARSVQHPFVDCLFAIADLPSR